MRFLVDNNLSYKLVKDLAEDFSGSVHVREALSIFAEDRDIWNYAMEHDFVILTKDNDFDEFALLYGCPPKVAHLLCGNKSTIFISNLILKYKADIIQFGAIDRENCVLKISG